MSNGRRKSVSVLGLISIVMGIAGLAAGWKFVQLPYAMLGGLGVLLGFAGLLRAGNGSVFPSLGVVLSLGVMAVPLYHSGWWHQHVRRSLPDEEAASPATQPNTSSQQSEVAQLHSPNSETALVSPDRAMQFPLNAPAFIRRPTMTAEERVAEAEAALHEARLKLKSAEEALQLSLVNDPLYRDADNDARLAEAKVREARAMAEPGGIELRARSKDWVIAKGRRNTILADAVQSDSGVASARQSMADAQAELEAARTDAIAAAQSAEAPH